MKINIFKGWRRIVKSALSIGSTLADNDCMNRNMTTQHTSPGPGFLVNSDVQFQLSLLRLMDPGSLPSPQAAQLEHWSEPAALAPESN
jgi:hypothetical protein